MNYIKRTLPLNDDLLLHAKVIDIKQRDAAKFESIEFFVHRYPHLQFLSVRSEAELLQEEFVSYQLLSDSDIPEDEWKKAEVIDDDSEHRFYSIDHLWGFISTMTKIGSTEPKFQRLFQVVQTILSFPTQMLQKKECLVWFARTKLLFVQVCHQKEPSLQS